MPNSSGRARESLRQERCCSRWFARASFFLIPRNPIVPSRPLFGDRFKRFDNKPYFHFFLTVLMYFWTVFFGAGVLFVWSCSENSLRYCYPLYNVLNHLVVLMGYHKTYPIFHDREILAIYLVVQLLFFPVKSVLYGLRWEVFILCVSVYEDVFLFLCIPGAFYLRRRRLMRAFPYFPSLEPPPRRRPPDAVSTPAESLAATHPPGSTVAFECPMDVFAPSRPASSPPVAGGSPASSSSSSSSSLSQDVTATTALSSGPSVAPRPHQQARHHLRSKGVHPNQIAAPATALSSPGSVHAAALSPPLAVADGSEAAAAPLLVPGGSGGSKALPSIGRPTSVVSLGARGGGSSTGGSDADGDFDESCGAGGFDIQDSADGEGEGSPPPLHAAVRPVFARYAEGHAGRRDVRAKSPAIAVISSAASPVDDTEELGGSADTLDGDNGPDDSFGVPPDEAVCCLQELEISPRGDCPSSDLLCFFFSVPFAMAPLQLPLLLLMIQPYPRLCPLRLPTHRPCVPWHRPMRQP